MLKNYLKKNGVLLLLALCGAAALGQHAARAQGAAEARPAAFGCNRLGYVRHWLVAGPVQAPYTGPGGGDNNMRQLGVEQRVGEPPAEAALGAPSPLGQPWSFYYPGQNFFVECSEFYHQLCRLDYYAETELEVASDAVVPAKLWAVGAADLWLNGKHLTRYYVPRDPEAQAVKLALRRGANRVCVRLQCVGIRDTNMLFGLQLLEGAGGVAVRLPGPAEATAQMAAAEAWLAGVAPQGRAALVAAGPAPRGVSVKGDGPRSFAWLAGQKELKLDPEKSFQLKVELRVAGQTLVRDLEIPANRPPAPAAGATLKDQQRRILKHIAGSKGKGDVWQLLARRLLKEPPAAADMAAIDSALKGIDGRKDCSDFALSALMRLHALKLDTPEEAAKLKAAALRFRYWSDEPGTDAMCFGSENHSLLFHGCQFMAGRFYADEVFSNSKRTGREQSALGLKRCLEWLDKTEKNGYQEYLSSTYMPLTAAALLNLVDFSGDEAIARRASALLDRLYNDLAVQAFDGVTVGPQGRVYRNVLYPQNSGTQALLAFATTAAPLSYTNWIAFQASSKYQPPQGLERVMSQPADKSYRHDTVEINVHKTADYLLTSLSIPAPFMAGKKDKKGKALGMVPGEKGYQQHLWHATLGRDCHVFVNNPGGSFDLSKHRPGYWYGNLTLPRLEQRRGVLLEIFDLPETNPFPFTHAHWPADAFDRQQAGGHWAFGAKGSGYVALWCSQALEPHSEVLTGRELRAVGRRAAWMCVCGSAAESGGFEAFIEKCKALDPSFDEGAKELKLKGAEGMKW